MAHLHERLSKLIDDWRLQGYPSGQYPAVAEILEWSSGEASAARFLRKPQLKALETYWYLRLVERTPCVMDLYRKYFPKQSELMSALGLDSPELQGIALDEGGVDGLLNRIATDDALVRDLDLEALRESLKLSYPSYILALAMGAGKTVLIGAIIASEFAMALEYPDGPFVQNALVFAPGTTIIESLRELATTPYDRILPPRLAKRFIASVKLTFTRDGEKTIPIIQRSLFNVVVTNTEKIRIQKETIRKSDIGRLWAGKEDEAREAVANLRLQAIASLPHLAIFSDEAHHTYGQSLESGLKRVRQTVDYLAAATNVVCVVNTTGTPYYKRQPLKDVVIWYGLSQGIRDNILKDLSGNIHSYSFDGDAAKYVSHVIESFFTDYGAVTLPNGSKAKLAIYFPQTDDLKDLKPVIDASLVRTGQSPTLCLVNTSDVSLTKTDDIAAFNRLNDPGAPHRVILLVNKGTEGWNCPSLFACALARKLKSSNNFVLQAATRCLRQVPGNSTKARVYLSTDNFKILDSQLRETYGESLEELNRTGQESRRARIILRKLDIPPLVVTQTVRTVVRASQSASDPLRLRKPAMTQTGLGMTRTTYTTAQVAPGAGVLQPVGETVEVAQEEKMQSAYGLAVDLGVRYRLDLWHVYDELRRLYGSADIPESDVDNLSSQIEQQTRNYSVKEEKVDVALALVKTGGFDRESVEGVEVYTAEIVYPKDHEHLLLRAADSASDNPRGYGFHYDPYNFDSKPEKAFFAQILAQLNLNETDVEDIYFTGALTDPAKTDFRIDYKDDKGKWRWYTPDFVIRRKPAKGQSPGSGKVYIVEVKSEDYRDDGVDGERGAKAMQLRRWESLNPERLKYEIVFTKTDTVGEDQTRNVRTWINEREP